MFQYFREILNLLNHSGLAIKDGASIFVPHLIYVFNQCVKTNVFTKQLKLADVTPLYKKDTLNVTNYRLISVTNAFSKIFDIILHAQITAHLEGEQILNPLQFGIRPQYSTNDSSLIFNRIYGSFPL